MTGLVSGLDAQKLALGADFSHWDGSIPQEVFGHLDFAWVKAADGDQLRAGSSTDYTNYVDVDFRANVQHCWDADIPCGIYLYIQPNFPNWSLTSIITHHFKALKAATAGLVAGKSYHAIALDFEETTNTANNLADIIGTLTDMILSDPEYAAVAWRGVTIYTRNSILDTVPAVRDRISNQSVLNKYQMWLAQWVWGANEAMPSINVTWETLKSVWIPKISMRVITPGFQDWDFVQWSNYFRINNSGFVFDLNFFRGNRDACWKWFNYTPRNVVVVPPPVVITPPPVVVDEGVTRAEFDALKAAFANHTHGVSKPNA